MRSNARLYWAGPRPIGCIVQASPHAIIITERKTPQPIFVAAFIGVERLLRVDFDLTADPATFVEQALRGVREKLARWRVGEIRTFGKPVEVVVNYTPDHAVEFDLKGSPLRVLDRAHRPGTASFSLKGRASPLSRGEIAAVIGGQRQTPHTADLTITNLCFVQNKTSKASEQLSTIFLPILSSLLFFRWPLLLTPLGPTTK